MIIVRRSEKFIFTCQLHKVLFSLFSWAVQLPRQCRHKDRAQFVGHQERSEMCVENHLSSFWAWLDGLIKSLSLCESWEAARWELWQGGNSLNRKSRIMINVAIAASSSSRFSFNVHVAKMKNSTSPSFIASRSRLLLLFQPKRPRNNNNTKKTPNFFSL